MEAKPEQYTKEKKDNRSLVNPKFNNVPTLQDYKGWRAWKSDVEDYCEETFKGMKKSMEYAKNEKKEPDMQLEDHAEKSEMLWRFLKKHTEGDAKRIVTNVEHDNGYEAWRQLNVHFEPELAVRQGHAMLQFTNMVAKRSKNSAETKTLLTEMEERSKRIKDLTNEAPSAGHTLSVILGILDLETLKFTARYQSKDDLDTLKQEIIKFTSLTAKNTDDMELGRVQKKVDFEDEAEKVEGDQSQDYNSKQDGPD